METSTIKENELKTILMFSVPSIIAMLLQTAITITDGYFTGNYVGENALAATNLGLPVLYFYLGVRVLSIRVDGNDKSYNLNLPKGCYIVKVGNVVRKISIR